MPATTCSCCGHELAPADFRHNRFGLCRECGEWWMAKLDDDREADWKDWRSPEDARES
jgi:hypothetical protein